MPNVYDDDDESLWFADESEWMDEHDHEEEDGDAQLLIRAGPGSWPGTGESALTLPDSSPELPNASPGCRAACRQLAVISGRRGVTRLPSGLPGGRPDDLHPRSLGCPRPAAAPAVLCRRAL
jgi:hypothetical protein